MPTSILANSKGANVKTFAAPYHHWDETVYAGGSYTPQAGDLALFAWSGTSETAASLSHTAIVHSVKQSGSRILLTVVHGNSGNEVCKKNLYRGRRRWSGERRKDRILCGSELFRRRSR